MCQKLGRKRLKREIEILRNTEMDLDEAIARKIEESCELKNRIVDLEDDIRRLEKILSQKR